MPSLLQSLLTGRNTLIPPEIQGLITIVFLALTLTFFYYIMVKTTPKTKEEQSITKTIIKCMGKDSIEEREFQEGDYIGKILGKCEDTGTTRYIHAIYESRTKRKSN